MSGDTTSDLPGPTGREEADGAGAVSGDPPSWLEPLIPRAVPGGEVDTVALVAVVGFFLVVRLAGRGRQQVRRGGLVDRGLALIILAGRLAMTAAVIVLLANLIPGWVTPVALAALVAVGWSARDIAPDLLAGLVLLAERRVLPGMEVSASGVEGVVEARGLRATVLRDERGRRVTLPNRHLLRAPLRVRGDGGRVHEASIQLPDGADRDAAALRAALLDTVATSPWVPAHARPEVRRDGDVRGRWWVRTELLDERHAGFFDGELLERLAERYPGMAGPSPPTEREKAAGPGAPRDAPPEEPTTTTTTP
ncbi:MAG TPA: mechanosensitive ion channel family protein [Polyangiaceae bacterium LLY-WYZ-14_1]|nr:mechanosensitive ion channel family protein [Polyangiaceae bacterium LLY-WYZ-14_1]